ncbi:MAG: hypothetical protein C4518_00880 [Desulfobacteraceae bacterium]|nr:MAG: hypothetical protein C4518_00880 [Desulfobacteraceae bacterium]
MKNFKESILYLRINSYAYAAVSVVDGVFDTLILPHVNSDCMQIFLDEVSSRHPGDRIVMVLDGAGCHRAGTLMVPENMKLILLPPYAPELNQVEHLWDELREKCFWKLCLIAWISLSPIWKFLSGR